MAKTLSNEELPVHGIDMINPTTVFSLGVVSRITQAMVDIQEVPDGFKLYSKHKGEEGYYKVYKVGVKGVRYRKPAASDEG